jgi:hypothetical protein
MRTALVVMPILFLVAVAPGMAQVSPGPLTQSHADLEGATKCLKCHASGSGSMNQRCRDCHTEIDFQVQRGLGLHGQDPEAECSSCHPDHAGRDFELITWEEGSTKRFEHRRTGWSLEGKHATLRCEQCHKPEFQSGGVVRLLQRKNPGDSWLGLERDCLSCHEDYHQKTLASDCLSCHGPDNWKPASKFDHARTKYPLTGKHTDTPCAKCHLVPDRIFLTSEGQAVPRYQPLEHAECSACHKDTHTGQLGPTCAKCHVTDGFKIVASESFDHAKTRYPLNGKHRGVECAKCHDPQRAWGKKPEFATCDRCHKDAHAGKATVAGQVVDCASCHGVNGFKPSTYTVERHRESKYPLAGKHETVTCDRCHTKTPPQALPASLGAAQVLMRPAHEQCRDCHSDLHGTQLARRPDGGACESCHRVDGWKPSTFSVAQHGELQFSLAGRHAEIECVACHGPTRPDLPALPGEAELGKARVALTRVESDCQSCHFDPHDKRFAPDGPRPATDGCRACHGARTFVPSDVDTDVHGRFAYKLQGAHRAVPCVMCHEELTRAPGKIRLLKAESPTRPLQFARKHEQCEACHQSPHGDQFNHRPDRGTCDGCHVVDGWHPAEHFDHEKHAKFSLQGAHQKVACDRCHQMTLDPEGRPFVVYRPVPGKCRDCHGRSLPQSVASERPSRGASS